MEPIGVQGVCILPGRFSADSFHGGWAKRKKGRRLRGRLVVLFPSANAVRNETIASQARLAARVGSRYKLVA